MDSSTNLKYIFIDIAAYRTSIGESQTVFWARYGVTQSGGSRYESGRTIPQPTAILIAAHLAGLLSDDQLLALRNTIR